ncbi:MAG TPA: amino acid adenylation domain-containing protein, partial [Thermoanaerobaculia bacterium]|nr:amino acid adenylation domain-containing protein [Thermoanaerobaculia bacterium]
MPLANVADVYALSPLQEGMLFHTLEAERAGVYVDQSVFDLAGALDLAAFAAAWRRAVERHPALRTAFYWRGLEQPHQVVHRQAALPLSLHDLAGLTPAARETEIAAFLATDRRRGFDLSAAPLLRVTLFRLAAERWRVVWSYHHILLDAWSGGIVLAEVMALYRAARERHDPGLPAPPLYRDYIAWLRRQDHAAAATAWRRELAGFSEPLAVPADRPRAAGALADRPRERRLELSAALSAALATAARRQRLTLNSLLQGAWALLLSRYCGTSDVVFGAVVSGRPSELAGFERAVGLFINTVPVRVDAAPEASLPAWLQRLQRRRAELAVYDHAPLAAIHGCSEVARHRPLFETILAFENAPFPSLAAVPGRGERPLSGAPTPGPAAGAQGPATPAAAVRDYRFATHYPLAASVWPGAALLLRLQYDSRRYHAATAARLLSHFAALLEACGSAAEARLGELPMLAAAERHQLIHECNDCQGRYPGERGLHELFAARVGRDPAAIAVAFGGERLTYAALDARSNQLAHHLAALGAGPEALVATLLERSVHLLAAILAILKAGAAYVPLDPEHPRERLRFVLDDSGAAALVTSRALAARLPAYAGRTVVLDDCREELSRLPATPPPSPGGGDLLAYVIYTSGSTGTPKGVAVPHRAVARLVLATNYVRIQPGDRILQASNPAFDAATFEVWGALLNGAAAVGISREEALSPRELARQIRELGATVAFVTTPLFTQLARLEPAAFAPLRQLLVGGETLQPEALRRVRAAGYAGRLLNVYGPTESTTFATWHEIAGVPGREPAAAGADARPVPIGRPLTNTRALVLDRRLAPVPPGVTGELFLGGDGLARGYLGRPDLTAERFVPDPLADRPGARLYRTGDLARRLPDGVLEFLGRADRQLKVRGFRVEPGEVEVLLAMQPEVGEALVMLREDRPGDPVLVAYLVPGGAEAPEIGALRAALRERLPEPMVPSAFVVLPRLPLNPNGKLDRAALPAPAGALPATSAAAAADEPLEATLAAIWREVLGVAAVGRHDNFFDLGGHSLRLLGVQGRLRDALGREVPIADLYAYPTVASLTAHLAAPEPPAAAAGPAMPAASGTSRRRRADGGIAVIGMAGRFPGAANVDELWANLCAGRDCISRPSVDELVAQGLPREVVCHPRYVRARGVLSGCDEFDAAFFGFSAREAAITDPQQRLFLECAWEALEDAGHQARRGPEAIGVFAGKGANTYFFNLLSHPELMASLGFYEALIASEKDFLAARVAYLLDLRGPSLSIQTACSTSLVAVHLACQSLRDGECDLAVAGGVAASANPLAGYLYDEGGILSPDGCCRAFDAGARGTVGGSGVAAVVLRRLDDAVAAGDSIRAVIRGSAVNNDGAARVGFTAPGVEGQAAVIARALAAADLAPAAVGYVEAHGTGTQAGDPIEIAALTRAFGAGEPGSCAVGSLKTNIGHLDAAAGVAGLIKAVLAVERGQIPPSLHFERPNPEIDLAAGPFFFNTELRAWPRPEEPRRAGVSSFGLGGSNAHVVLEQAPPALPSGPSRSWQLLPLSARTTAALERASASLAEHLRRHPEQALADVAYTLQQGRRAFGERRAVVAREGRDAAAALAGDEPEGLLVGRAPDEPRTVAFLFPGQGPQYPGMTRQLYRSEAVFRETVDLCAELLLPPLGLDLRQALYADGSPEDRLAETALAQPAMFVVEYALARLLLSWGVRPAAMLGHSLGEYVAACLAEVIELPDALAAVAERGARMQEQPAGALLAVPLAERELLARLPAGLAVAAVNGPAMCLVSGPPAAVAEQAHQLAAEGVEVRPLPGRWAFHSPAMAPVAAPVVARLSRARLRPPRIPYLSNRTGRWLRDEEALDPGYWAGHLSGTVRFSDGLAELVAQPGRVLLEVGPGHTLSRLARRHPACGARVPVISTLPARGDATPEEAFLLGALGRLWLCGIEPDWAGLSAGERRRRVRLPTYPFERQRHWVAPGERPSAAHGGRLPDPADWFYAPCWRPGTPLRALRAATPAAARWLLFVDQLGLGTRLAALLREQGAAVTEVAAGQRFERSGDAAFILDPARPADYETLISRLAAEGRLPQVIAHLWSVGGGGERRGATVPDVQPCLDRGLWSALALAKALGELVPVPAIRIGFVADGMQRVTAGDLLEPEKATLLGACKVIPQEIPELSCLAIDLDPRATGLEEAAAALLRELAAEAAPPVVAHRGGSRYLPALAPVRLAVRADHPAPLRERGVYLITGGLGGIGLGLAGYLARTVGARLALVGRSPFPARELWPGLATAAAGEASPTAARVRALVAMEELGGEVLVLSADVADRTSMRRALAQARRRFGPLNGVVHAAGVPGAGLLRATTREAAARVLAAKVDGTLVLEELLRDEDLDFLVLCSSLSALLGGLGQAAYCAANCFLDAFAEAGRGSRATLALDWEIWREAGMALTVQVPAELREARRLEIARGLSHAEGAEALHRALWSGMPRLAVSVEDLPARIDRYQLAALARVAAGGASRETAPGRPRPQVSTPYVAAANEVEQRVGRVVEELLGCERIGRLDDFFELGGHSLLATQLLSRLRDAFHVELRLEQLFAAPTVAAIAAAIASQQVAAAETAELVRLLA